MLKLFGVLTVLLGSAGVGRFFVGKYGFRRKLLQEIQVSLQFVYGEIAYAEIDILDIFMELSRENNYFSNLWGGIERRLRTGEARNLSQVWTEEWGKNDWTKYLTKQDREWLLDLGKHLGTMDRDSELHTLQIYQKRLEHILGTLEKEYYTKQKISMVLSLSLGAILSIAWV